MNSRSPLITADGSAHPFPFIRHGAPAFFHEVVQVVGRRVVVLLLSCIATGLLLGAIEIAFGVALYNVLSYYHFLPDNMPEGYGRVFAPIPPVLLLIVL